MKIKDGFVLEKVGDAYLAVAVGELSNSFSGIVKMNESGAFFWNLIKDKDKSESEMLKAALLEYDADESLLSSDIHAFIEKLRDAGVLE